MKPNNYEPILKEPLVCFKCNSEIKNIPTLKNHLQEEWDKLERRAKPANKKKTKLPDPKESPAEASSALVLDHEEDKAVKPEQKRTRIEESTIP